MAGVKSEQIKDQEVKRDDLNTTESGQAVIAKVIAGPGIAISYTGADPGTGDVTVSATTLAAQDFLASIFDILVTEIVEIPARKEMRAKGYVSNQGKIINAGRLVID